VKYKFFVVIIPVVISKKGRIRFRIYSFQTSHITENKTTKAQMLIMLWVASDTELTKVSPQFCGLSFSAIFVFVIFDLKKTANIIDVKTCDKSRTYPKFFDKKTFSPTASTTNAGPAFTQ